MQGLGSKAKISGGEEWSNGKVQEDVRGAGVVRRQPENVALGSVARRFSVDDGRGQLETEMSA